MSDTFGVSMEEEAAHDERIMADGRPAFAWWNEIQMLRAEKAIVDSSASDLKDMMALLRIAECQVTDNRLNGDLIITLTRLERIAAKSTTLRGLIAEYVELERERK